MQLMNEAAVKTLKLSETFMKLSARNVLQGKIAKVHKGTTTSHVTIEVNGSMIMAAITNEAVEEMGLKEGMNASAVIKSSDVIVAVD